jgi:hypothetical protein
LAPHRRHSTPTPSSNAASASTTTRRSIAPAVPSSRRHHRSSIIANGIGFQLNDKDDDSSKTRRRSYTYKNRCGTRARRRTSPCYSRSH